MRRREFAAGALLVAATLRAPAQQRPRQRRIAIFHPAIPAHLITETGGGTAWRAFFAELRRLGYIEGDNPIIESSSAEGHHERYDAMAREIVSRNPELIVTGTNPVVTAFRAATTTIPIVAFMLDPLKAGPVTGLARPGGNRIASGRSSAVARAAVGPFGTCNTAIGCSSKTCEKLIVARRARCPERDVCVSADAAPKDDIRARCFTA